MKYAQQYFLLFTLPNLSVVLIFISTIHLVSRNSVSTTLLFTNSFPFYTLVESEIRSTVVRDSDTLRLNFRVPPLIIATGGGAVGAMFLTIEENTTNHTSI